MRPAAAPLADVDDEEEEEEEEDPGWLMLIPILAALAYEMAFEAIDSGGIQITIMFLTPLFLALKRAYLNLVNYIQYGGEAPSPPPGALAPPFAPPPPPPPDLIGTTSEKVYAFAEDHPIYYFLIDFGTAAVIGTFFLFLQDIQNYFAKRRAAAKLAAKDAAKKEADKTAQMSTPEGYQPLIDEAGADGSDEPAVPSQSIEQMKRELIRMTDKAEELEIKTRVDKKSEKGVAMREELKQTVERREELKQLLGVGGPVMKRPKEEKQVEPSMMTKIMKSTAMQVMQKAADGVMSATLYIADLWSDIQVVMMLFNTGNILWASISCCILVSQFIVIYLRVLPYLSTTFGDDSTLYRMFLWLGFPWGCVALDVFMFIEPFGLLTVLPFPEWVRQFIPAYKATRLIAEVP